MVHAVEAQLSRRIRDSFLGSEQGAELRRVGSAAHRVLAVLADHGLGGAESQQKISLHPYLLFASIRGFFMGAWVLEDEQGEVLGAQPPYTTVTSFVLSDDDATEYHWRLLSRAVQLTPESVEV